MSWRLKQSVHFTYILRIGKNTGIHVLCVISNEYYSEGDSINIDEYTYTLWEQWKL